MTEILSGFFPSQLGPSSFDPMLDRDSEQPWRQEQYFSDMPMLSGSQGGQTEHVSRSQGIDVSRIYSQDQNYPPYSGTHTTSGTSYHHDSWASSDMDMGTPSTSGFPNEVVDGYQRPLQPFGHLLVPYQQPTGHSPQSSHSAVSPQLATADMEDERPQYGRAHTDPTQKRRATAPAAGGAKQGGSSEDEDEDCTPTIGETKSGRGRKRQRIPHTAVERRYRENLNAHLDKLRQTVPSLASRKGLGKEGEGVKPSKCEILSGAIDYIGTTDRENVALKNEVRALRQKILEYEQWYRR